MTEIEIAAKKLCEKFIRKVELGWARSKTTLAECQSLLEMINEKEELVSATMRTEHLQLRKRTRRLIAADMWIIVSFQTLLIESVDTAKGLRTTWKTPDSISQCRAHENILYRYYYILG